MPKRNWISELRSRFLGNDSDRFTYWRTEGLCKVERTPTIMIPETLIGSTLAERESIVSEGKLTVEKQNSFKLPETQIKRAVRRHYAKLAELNQPCCGSTVERAEEDAIPVESVESALSCGSPLNQVNLQGGDIVLDLGSGVGVDVFRASKLVGPAGRVIGVDATPEMIFKARDLAEKYDYKNVEFRLGEIEHLPIENNSIDLVISNCVLNLVPDKAAAFREIYRALKPSGRIVISDTVATGSSKKEIDYEEWAACIAGAIPIGEYRALLEQTGFEEIYCADESHSINERCCPMNILAKSVTWLATKPIS
jgi:arsenite methyltransferase